MGITDAGGALGGGKLQSQVTDPETFYLTMSELPKPAKSTTDSAKGVVALEDL
jgi:hypothetical protein